MIYLLHSVIGAADWHATVFSCRKFAFLEFETVSRKDGFAPGSVTIGSHAKGPEKLVKLGLDRQVDNIP